MGLATHAFKAHGMLMTHVIPNPPMSGVDCPLSNQTCWLQVDR